MAETHALDYKIDIKDELPTEHKLDIEAISPREEKPAALSRNPFKRRREKRKKMALEKLKDEIPDPREPNIKFIDHLVLLKIIGFKNWVLIFFATIGAGGAGVIGLCFQFILGDLINSLATIMSDTTALRNEVNSIAGKFAIVALGAVIANFMNQFFNTLASETISRTLKQRYFESLTAQEMAFFDIKKVGQLACIASDDVAVVQEIYTSKWSTFFQQIVQVVVGLILAFISSWKMTLVIISTSPIIFVLICGVSQGIKMLAKKTSESNEHASSIATEIISSIKTVRSMGGEPKERIRYRNDLKKVHRYGLFKSILQGGVFFILSFTIWGTVALSFWFGGGLTVDGEISVGSMFRVFGLSLMAVMALSNAGTFFTEYARAIQSQTSLLKVIRRVPEIPFKGGKTIENLRGDISIKNIDFIYPARPNITVLKNFSLEIKTGQAVAFVGPSGSGKSTIVGLIERFYNPVRGQISIDNVDISELDPMWLHQVVGIVNQEPTLFACSIRDNISYACRRPVTQEEIEEAAKAANCHSFILDLPDGYNTLLGEKGVSLSGGQKQRIAIARALLQDPKILLLDEATSALDTESEALVQAALDKLMKGRTTICIAHRLSTVKNSDMLCVLSKGILVEKGKHEELIHIQDGVYKKLAEKQMMFSSTEEDEVADDEEIIEEKNLKIVDY